MAIAVMVPAARQEPIRLTLGSGKTVVRVFSWGHSAAKRRIETASKISRIMSEPGIRRFSGKVFDGKFEVDVLDEVEA